MENQEKRAYEISFLAKGEEAVGAVIKHLNEVGAEITNEKQIEKTDLAYPIEKFESAHFGSVHFRIEPTSIKDLKEALKFEDGILRYLLVTPPIAKDDITRPKRAQVESRELSGEKPTTPSEGVVSNEDLEAKLEEISSSLDE